VVASTQAALSGLGVYTGTDTVSIGTATIATGPRLRVYGAITGAVGSNAVVCDSYVAADVTSSARSFLAYPSTTAAAFTLAQLVSFYSGFNSKGAGSTITSHIGFLAESSMTQATNNYGFVGNIAAATGCWNLYCGGTAQNYFGGRVGIGTTAPASSLEVMPAILTTGNSQGINAFMSNTGNAVTYAVMAQSVGTASSGYNTGFYANAYGAAYNYAVRIVNPSSASASNWAIYSDATAQSYFAGNIGIGTSTPTNQLDVSGSSIRIRTASSPTSAATAGNIGEIRWDSGFLYICTATGVAGSATWKKVALSAA